MALAISLGFTTLFFVFGVLEERALQDSLNRLLRERLAITQLVADQIDTVLDEAVSEMELVNAVITFSDQPATFESIIPVVSESYGRIGLFASGVILLDAQGRVVYTEPPQIYAEGADLSTKQFVQDPLEQMAVTIADPFPHPQDQKPVTAVSVPIVQNEQFIGLLVGFLQMDGRGITSPMHRATIVGQTEHAVLVDHEGLALASTFGLPFRSPGEHQTFYQEAMRLGEPTIETIPFELDLPNEPQGHLHVMAFVPLKNAPWGLAVGGDLKGDTFSSVDALRTRLIVLGIISLVLIWLITLVGTRRLIVPVETLTQSAHQIAGGNLDTPLHIAGGGEIGLMASAINDMRNQLLMNIDQLSEWNENLEQRVFEQTEHLNQQQELTQLLLKRVIHAQEGERRRIAYELHDEIGQMLTAVEMSLQHLGRTVAPEDVELNTRLIRSRKLTEKTVTDLRRIIAALRPTVLDQLGLVAALNWIGEQLLLPQQIEFQVVGDLNERPLTNEIETTLFRIAQEALNNIARHSQAQTVTITVEQTSTEIMMRIEDDGQGFDPQAVEATPMNGRGMGLVGIRERAYMAGGRATVVSTIGKGTAVHVTIPQPSSEMSESHVKSN